MKNGCYDDARIPFDRLCQTQAILPEHHTLERALQLAH
jgi:hypothetical protein